MGSQCMCKDVNHSIVYYKKTKTNQITSTYKLWYIYIINHCTAIKKNVLKWKNKWTVEWKASEKSEQEICKYILKVSKIKQAVNSS